MSSVGGNSNQAIADAFNKLNQDAASNDASRSGQVKQDAQQLLNAITNGADLSTSDRDNLLSHVVTLLPMAGEPGHAEEWNPEMQNLADSLSSILSNPSPSTSDSNAAVSGVAGAQFAQKQVQQVGSGSPGASATSAQQPAGSLSATDFGVKGDGATDNTAALQQAISAAKSQGKTLWLPPGTYNHSGEITLDGASMQGAGSSTILKATNPTGSAIKLTGNSPQLSNIATQVSSGTRSSQPDDSAVLVQDAQNAVVSQMSIQGASANGIRLANANGSQILNNFVNGSNADGIALCAGSSNNLIQRCQVMNASDDSFSSDSYQNVGGSAEKQNSGNVFDSCYAGPNRIQGRGFALMGSTGDTIKNCVSEGSLWHGMVAGTDADSGTYDGSNETLSNNLVLGAAGDAVRLTRNNGKDASSDPSIGSVSGTQTSGSAASTLGWTPTTNVLDPSTFNTYAGGGSGSDNQGGIRT